MRFDVNAKKNCENGKTYTINYLGVLNNGKAKRLLFAGRKKPTSKLNSSHTLRIWSSVSVSLAFRMHSFRKSFCCPDILLVFFAIQKFKPFFYAKKKQNQNHAQTLLFFLSVFSSLENCEIGVVWKKKKKRSEQHVVYWFDLLCVTIWMQMNECCWDDCEESVKHTLWILVSENWLTVCRIDAKSFCLHCKFFFHLVGRSAFTLTLSLSLSISQYTFSHFIAECVQSAWAEEQYRRNHLPTNTTRRNDMQKCSC